MTAPPNSAVTPTYFPRRRDQTRYRHGLLDRAASSDQRGLLRLMRTTDQLSEAYAPYSTQRIVLVLIMSMVVSIDVVFAGHLGGFYSAFALSVYFGLFSVSALWAHERFAKKRFLAHLNDHDELTPTRFSSTRLARVDRSALQLIATAIEDVASTDLLKNLYPDSQLDDSPNSKGYDVWPFLRLLQTTLRNTDRCDQRVIFRLASLRSADLINLDDPFTVPLLEDVTTLNRQARALNAPYSAVCEQWGYAANALLRAQTSDVPTPTNAVVAMNFLVKLTETATPSFDRLCALVKMYQAALPTHVPSDLTSIAVLNAAFDQAVRVTNDLFPVSDPVPRAVS